MPVPYFALVRQKTSSMKKVGHAVKLIVYNRQFATILDDQKARDDAPRAFSLKQWCKLKVRDAENEATGCCSSFMFEFGNLEIARLLQ
jgi:hypothetical protein